MCLTIAEAFADHLLLAAVASRRRAGVRLTYCVTSDTLFP